MAFNLARAFGAGMGLGRICGAVSGAFMVLGFKYQNEEPRPIVGVLFLGPSYAECRFFFKSLYGFIDKTCILGVTLVLE